MMTSPLMTLGDIMTREICTLPPEATLRDAASRMTERHVSSILILRDEQVLGIVTEGSIMRALHAQRPGDTRLDSVMSQPVITAAASLDLVEARRLAEAHHIHHLVVTDDAGAPCGIVSDSDFRTHLDPAVFDHRRSLAGVMERQIPQLPPDARLGEAIDRMLRQAADYLIVSDGNRPLGILTERDIPRLLQMGDTPLDLPLREAMSSPLRSVHVDHSLTVAIETMSRHRLRHIPVVSDNGHVLGVVSQRRLFDQLALEQMADSLRAAQQERDRLRLQAQLQLALDASGAGTREYRHDLDRHSLSDGLLALLGCPSGAGPHPLDDWLQRIHPDDRHLLNSTVDSENAADFAPRRCEYRIRHQDGRWLWVEDRHCVTERFDDGRPRLTTSVVLDITERQLARQQITRQNRALQLMTAIGQVVVRHQQESDMLEGVCATIVELGRYRAAWFSELQDDATRRIVPVAESGLGDRCRIRFANAVTEADGEQGPTLRAILSGVPTIVQDVDADSEFPGWREVARALGCRALIALPLRVDGRVIGALNLCSEAPDVFDDQEVPLLDNLVGEIGLSLGMYRSRQTLAKSEARLLEAQQTARLGHFTYTPATDRLSGSPIFHELLGLPAGEAIPRDTLLSLIHPADRERMALGMQGDADSNPLRLDGQFRIRRGSDGAERWLHVTARPGGDGEKGRLFGICQDITERHTSEEQLQKLWLAIDQSPHSIIITNTDKEIEYINDAFIRHSGYTREDVIGKTPRLLQSGLTPKETYDALQAALHDNQAWRGEFINRRKDGTIYEEFAIVSPVRQPDGRVTHYLAIKEDVTEKKRTQAELEHHRHNLETLVAERTEALILAKDAAESASRAKSAFLANISHEIRTPMNAILGLTHLAQQSAESPEQRKRLARVTDAANHLMGIINDVLDFSRIEADKLALENTDFTLSRVCNMACEMVAQRAEAKQLKLTHKLDSALPAMLHGDPLRLQQVMVNFLSNAVKFTEQGEIELSVQLLRKTDDRIKIRCEVRDTGIGIPAENQDCLFRPFEQAEMSTTRRYGGTGLGLAISQRLVRAMHGDIGVHSIAGQGSTFWFTVTLQPGTTTDAPPQGAQLPTAAFRAGTCVLLAEDDPINAEVASHLLRSVGLTVDIAENGGKVVVKARQRPYDLVLMDMQMPVMSGIEATRQLRRLPGWERIPIIAMTANAFDEDRANCLAAGMNDHLAKPVPPEALFSMLARWLPAQSLSPSLPIPTKAPPRPIMEMLTAIPGLDSRAGLQTLRGRIDSYYRLLHRFTDSHADSFSQLRDDLAGGRNGEAERFAHTMKGTAATLGATRIHQAAAALEQGIREQRPTDRLIPLVDELEDAFLALRDHLATVPEQPGKPARERAAPPVDPTAVARLLDTLRHGLECGEISVQDLVRTEAATLRLVMGDAFPAFEEMTAAFDFEHALACLNQAVPPAE